jgi:uncharacterized protein
MFKETVQTLEELRSLYGLPSQRAVQKQRETLDRNAREFIALSPFVLIASTDTEGRCDVSPKGDAPGFVRALDEKHLVIPDRPGNNRLDSLVNLLEHPRIGLLFLIPGRGDTLRVNGKARIVRDEDLLAHLAVDGRKPKTAIGVEVDEVYLHCPKAFMRSSLWSPESWPSPDAIPSLCEMLWDQLPGIRPEFKDVKEFETAMDASLEKTLY